MTKDTVTLSRTDWKRISEALDEAADRKALRASVARERAAKDDAVSAALYRRLRAGESPVRIWREQRGLGLNELARKARVAPGYLSEIENRLKPGSVTALRRLSNALAVDLDELVRR